MDFEQILATYEKSVKMFHMDTPNTGHVLSHLSHVPIAGFMSTGVAGTTGMFMGRSISTPASVSLSQPATLTTSPTESPITLSLLAPLSLVPSSWQFDLALGFLRGEVPEETLLVVLAKEYLGDRHADRPSGVRVSPILPFSGGSQPDRNPSSGVMFSPQSSTPGGAESMMR